jgi:hypothetical protein
MKPARTLAWPKTHRHLGRYNGPAQSWRHQFCPDCIIATPGYDFQEGQRLGVGLIATIAALVLGLLIGAAKGSFDTQTTQLKQITANLIMLDNIRLAAQGRLGNNEAEDDGAFHQNHCREMHGPSDDQ